MLDLFGNKIKDSIDDLGRKTKIEESDLKEVIKSIKMTLLEADVNYKVVKDFTKEIEEKALNQDILKGLNPREQILKIVREEMVGLLKGENELKLGGTNIILMVGLQGAGKTTTTGKIASLLRKKKVTNKPLLIAGDVYRPAAIDQLHVIGKQLGIDVYSNQDEKNVNKIVSEGIDYAKENGFDLILIDTAGRTHVDEVLMEEIKDLQDTYNPDETLLVIDSTVGQIATDVADSFKNYVNITGLVFTKMDGDAKGGGLFSVKRVTGADIKFIGTGEKMSDISMFDPQRVVGSILGEGDLFGLIEKAEEFTNEEEASKLTNKILEGKFDLDDFLGQMKMLKKMGGLTSVMSMIPGMNKIDTSQIDEGEFKKIEAIIESMTIEERINPLILNASRRKRISAGCGRQVSDVNQLIKKFEQSKKVMKQMRNMQDMDISKLIK